MEKLILLLIITKRSIITGLITFATGVLVDRFGTVTVSRCGIKAAKSTVRLKPQLRKAGPKILIRWIPGFLQDYGLFPRSLTTLRKFVLKMDE